MTAERTIQRRITGQRAQSGSSGFSGDRRSPSRYGPDIYLSPAAFQWPEYLEHLEHSSWIDHAPFAFWLVDALRPSTFVELGTHNGYSYFAFCQAVRTFGLDTRCYAVDHWKGDEHAGFFGAEILQRVQDYNERHYSDFSRLVRSTFDEALAHFSDSSIDLLHIDGRHFYDDVKHDFESWRPKLSDRAIVLFHDTNVREHDFGVFKLWEELQTEFPSFEFLHGHGLGVIGVGTSLPEGIGAFLTATGEPNVATEVRQGYGRLGTALKADFEARITQSRLTAKLSEQTGRAGELEAKVAERDGRIAGLDQAVAERDGRIADLDQAVAEHDKRIAGLKAQLAGVYSSRSWQITAPLRAVSLCARWVLRNLRRALLLTWWLGTGQFSRASKATHPYYQRYVPLHVKRMIPKQLREALKRRYLRFKASEGREAVNGRNVPAGQPAGNQNRKPELPSKTKPSQVKPGRPAPAQGRSEPISYEEWIARNDTLSDKDRRLIRSHIAQFQTTPKFSIIMPVYNTPAAFLREAIESARHQLYANWELCVADDASTSSEVGEILRHYEAADSRIRVTFREVNGGISACSNTALEMANGDWIALMDHDDVLAEHALYMVAEAINIHRDATIIYSDEDHIDADGRRSTPYFKPDWDYDLFHGQNLINHLGVYRAVLVRQVGGFRDGFEGSQDWDLALRVREAAPGTKVHHIPFVLYHWRQTSMAFSTSALERAANAARRAVAEHFERTGQNAIVVSEGHSSYLRTKRVLPEEHPLVSIVVPTKDRHSLLRTCTDGLIHRTSYKPTEIVIVDNGSTEPDACALLADLGKRGNVKVLRDNGAFNFSRLVNRGVAESAGDVIVLLNNDVDIINPDWLEEMVSHAIRAEVGSVGAKLYYADGTLQHGGVILGIGGVAAHVHKKVPRNFRGYFSRLNLTHSLSCVTAACLATRREVYEALGGFNEADLAVAFNDVDYCIRVREAGYRIIWTPHAELYHYESKSRGYEKTGEQRKRFASEAAYMRAIWGRLLDDDPYYNPNLTLMGSDIGLAEISRARKPWLVGAAKATF